MRINKKAAVVAVAAVTLAGSGIAYAYWTTTGTGSDSATTSSGDATAFTIVDKVAPASSLLAPNLAGGTLSGNVLNTSDNHSNNAVRTVTAVLTVTPVVASPVNVCDATNYVLKPSAATGQSTEVSAYALSAANSKGTEVLYVTGADATHVVDLTSQSIPGTPVATDKVAFATNLSFVNKPQTLQDGCKGATVNIAYTTGS